MVDRRMKAGPAPILASVLAAILATTLLAAVTSDRAQARHAAMVIDANSGQVLHQQAADEPRYPASLTKMMTLYMAFELIDLGRLSYASKITMSQEAASAAPSKLDLEPGETVTLLDAIKALVTKSANDVAVALAEHIGGTEANFARLMTAKARQIGMASTTFRNASGLPDTGQVTTARDMITLALRLQDDFPRHYGLFSTRSFTYAGNAHRNHNTLLGSFAGTDGIKTGYTRASGFNLVTSVRRDGRHVVGAVFGGSSAASRNAHMRLLINRSIAKASPEKTRKPILVAKPRPAPRPDRVPGSQVAAIVVPKATPPPPPALSARQALAPAVAAPVATSAPTVTDRADESPIQARSIDSVIAESAVSKIEIAKVRRVMVAPRPRPQREASPDATTEEPPAASEAIAPASPPAAAAAAATVKLAAAATIVPSPAVALPVSVASAPAKIAVREPAAVALHTPAGPSPGALARSPSTLTQQPQAIGVPAAPIVTPATRLAAAEPSSPRFRLNGPKGGAATTPPSAPTGAAFQIQIGAYASAVEAERQLASVKSRAGMLLASHPAVSLPVQKGDRQLFRARFAGFDASAAAGTCTELRRLAIDCFVMKAE